MKATYTPTLTHSEAVKLLVWRSCLTHAQLAIKIGLTVHTFENRLHRGTLNEYPREMYKLDLLLIEYDIKKP